MAANSAQYGVCTTHWYWIGAIPAMVFLGLVIGGLFVLYGAIVTLAGVTASDADLDKAEGVNINLWTGLGMLALGLFFLGWLWLRPLKQAPVPEEPPAE